MAQHERLTQTNEVLMKLEFVVLILALVSVGQEAKANSYSTAFPAVENPLSQSAVWIEGQATGRQWHNCASEVGWAYGTMPDNLTGNAQYSDSACVLAGKWGSNQSATGTVYVSAPSSSGNAEVELHLNMTITSNSASGYEFNCSTVAANPYLQIVRWNGPLGSWTSLALVEGGDYCQNGDVLTANNVNGQLTLYKNGTLITSASDQTFSGGSPGMGFYNYYASVPNSNWGFSNFSANDSEEVASAAPTVSLKWTPTTAQTEILKAQVSSASGCGSVTQWNAVATLTGGSYTDQAVTANGYYCYTMVPIYNGLSGQPSSIIEVQATSAPSTGTVLSPPSVPLQITAILGSALN
jgi:hypothetical protein